MKRILTLRWPRTGALEARIVWNDGGVEVVEASDDVRAVVEEFVKTGLHDWAGDREQARPRTTLANDHDFLPRLGQHLKRQAGFDPKVEDERAPAPLRVARANNGVRVALDSRSIAMNSKSLAGKLTPVA